jgi:hypothetical protein
MTKAGVTTENRPTYRFDKHTFIKVSHRTHENKGRVQTIIIFLEKSHVVLFGKSAGLCRIGLGDPLE